MKLHHLVTSLVLAVALPLAIAVSPAAADDPPTAALALTGPATGTSIASGKPTFGWAPLTNAGTFSISVTSSTKTDSAGQLIATGKYYVNAESADGSSSSFRSTFTYPPGTYYWQVSTNTYDATTNVNQAYLSAVAKFVVPDRFTLTKFAAKMSTNPANSLKEIEVNGKLACNLTNSNSPMTIAMKVYRGAKKVGSQTRDGGYCLGSKSTKQFLNFQPRPGAIKKGTKLTVKIVASSGSAHSSTTTVKLTWK